MATTCIMVKASTRSEDRLTVSEACRCACHASKPCRVLAFCSRPSFPDKTLRWQICVAESVVRAARSFALRGKGHLACLLYSLKVRGGRAADRSGHPALSRRTFLVLNHHHVPPRFSFLSCVPHIVSLPLYTSQRPPARHATPVVSHKTTKNGGDKGREPDGSLWCVQVAALDYMTDHYRTVAWRGEDGRSEKRM